MDADRTNRASFGDFFALCLSSLDLVPLPGVRDVGGVARAGTATSLSASMACSSVSKPWPKGLGAEDCGGGLGDGDKLPLGGEMLLLWIIESNNEVSIAGAEE